MDSYRNFDSCYLLSNLAYVVAKLIYTNNPFARPKWRWV